MRKSLMLLLASTLIISGCLLYYGFSNRLTIVAIEWAIIARGFISSLEATKKQLVPTGGSKSDGTVRMSYSYGMFESPVVDPQQGMNAAKARCAAWGYSGAEPFGGFTSQCSQPSSSGCMQTLVTIEYQCTGDIKK